jgi:hypothetical protein
VFVNNQVCYNLVSLYANSQIKRPHITRSAFTSLVHCNFLCSDINDVIQCFSILDPPQFPTKKTPLEALAFLLNNKLSKEQYNNIKASCTQSQANIWPNYNKLLDAKKKCRPEGIVVQELSAHVPLQNLMDHTAKQILLSDCDLVDQIKELAESNNQKLSITFYFKFGFDGCGSFNTFMQKGNNGRVPDGSTLLTSQMVPLQAVAVVGVEKVLLHNSSMPNNANACRPIRLCYERETKDTIRREAERLKAEVDGLSPLILINSPRVTVSFKGLFTMIDGKVLNELTSNPASSRCPICHKTSRQVFNFSNQSNVNIQ